MNTTDPIADMLTRIRNASAARHKDLTVPSSKVKREIARVLTEEGFIESWTTEPGDVQESLSMRLKYVEGRTPVVSGLKRISKPGLRVYARKTEIPRVEKVIVNIGLGEAIQNAKAVDAAVGDLAIITGQRPIVTRAKRSIAQFRLRTGMPIGAKVTLRGQRMYDFLERTLSLALPRIRDFRGIPTRSFDGRGNFSLGLREQLVYPEIDYDKIDRLRGFEVSIVTTARTDEEGRKLLQLLGMPFQAT